MTSSRISMFAWTCRHLSSSGLGGMPACQVDSRLTDGTFSDDWGCRGGYCRRLDLCCGWRWLGRARAHAGDCSGDGRPELVSIEEAPDDAIIATAAAIGAPAGTTDWEMQGVDYVRAVQLLQDALGKPVYGLIIGQNGMSSTLNAWLPSALLGVKVIDAVGDI